MFGNLIVGIDGRPGGADAVALASQLCAAEGKLTLVNVRGGNTRSALTSTPHRPDPEAQSLSLLREAREQTEVDAELVSVASGSPGRALHVLAEERAADLIVVGSCGRGTLGRAMLGDDTKAALNGAPCAVAIAAKGYANAPRPLASIGVGYDASPESEQALKVAREISRERRSLMKAMEVVSIPTYAFTGGTAPAIGQSIEEMLTDAEAELASLTDVEGKAVFGLPGEELARFGEEVDLLIVGSRGYGPMKRLMLGSTANYLQRHAHCSLLVLPRLAHAKPATNGQEALTQEDDVTALAPAGAEQSTGHDER